MGADNTGITGNHDRETGSDYVCLQCGPWPPGRADEIITPHEEITRRLDHLDGSVHELMQAAERIEKHLTAIAADVEAARPLLEKWQHSKIRKLAEGIGKENVPWQAGP